MFEMNLLIYTIIIYSPCHGSFLDGGGLQIGLKAEVESRGKSISVHADEPA